MAVSKITVRIVALAMLFVLVSVGSSSFLIYRKIERSLEKSLASELLSVVTSVGPLIDGDLHDVISLDSDGVLFAEEEFELIRQQLVLVKNGNSLSGPGSPIYTMRPAFDFDASGALEFVVMTDRDATGHFFTGNRYDAKPHQLEALNGAPTATGVYSDSEGAWISAAAPIKDSLNNVVGLIQADRHVDFFYARARGEAVSILLTSIAVVLVAGGLVFVLGFRVVGQLVIRPARAAVEQAKAIAEGDFRSGSTFPQKAS
jgi:hypothetical protein